jgi:hypothetical protein
MKRCSKCGEQSEVQFDSCWNCTTPFECEEMLPAPEVCEVFEFGEGAGLFALTTNECRALVVAVGMGLVPPLLWWVSPRASGVSFGALLLELPALLVLAALQPKGGRWPFTLVALPYALIILFGFAIVAGLVFGGGLVQ